MIFVTTFVLSMLYAVAPEWSKVVTLTQTQHVFVKQSPPPVVAIASTATEAQKFADYLALIPTIQEANWTDQGNGIQSCPHEGGILAKYQGKINVFLQNCKLANQALKQAIEQFLTVCKPYAPATLQQTIEAMNEPQPLLREEYSITPPTPCLPNMIIENTARRFMNADITNSKVLDEFEQVVGKLCTNELDYMQYLIDPALSCFRPRNKRSPVVLIFTEKAKDTLTKILLEFWRRRRLLINDRGCSVDQLPKISFGSQQPGTVRELIDNAYYLIASCKPIEAGYTQMGSPDYNMFGPDTDLVQRILQNSPGSTNDYKWILDLGSVTPQWAENMASHCNTLGLKVKIISLTGDLDSASKGIKIGHCHVFHHSGVKIESITSELKRLGLNDVRFDAFFSKMCFLHLTDPFATFYELYKRLNPTGYFVIDGFSMKTFHPSHTRDIEGPLNHYNLMDMLGNLTDGNLLVRHYCCHGSYPRFIGGRKSLLPIDLFYHKIENSGYAGGREVVVFETSQTLGLRYPSQIDCIHSIAFPDEDCSRQGVFGSLAMYQKLLSDTATHSLPFRGNWNQDL